MDIIQSIKTKFQKSDLQVVGIMLLAIALRLILLGVRPAHHDEGINGWFADGMLRGGFYDYDPENYHGPLHFYIIFLFQTLFGRSELILRLPTAIVSILTVYWIFKFIPFFGRKTCLITALVMAISPGFVFYGRYAIHESDFVFFMILSLWGVIGLWHEGERKHLWATVLGVAGLILTKETYIVHFVCFGIAWFLTCMWEKVSPSEGSSRVRRKWKASDLLWSLSTSIFLIVFFYTGGFLDIPGIVGIVETYSKWIHTGVSQGGHSKPFTYWVDLMFNYEPIALLGLVFCFRYFGKANRWFRLLAFYSIGVFLIYSYVSYKTPWCLISFAWTQIFIFADTLVKLDKKLLRYIFILLIIAALFKTVKLNFINYDNEKESYVYVHTHRDIRKIQNPLMRMVDLNKSNYSLQGHVLRGGEWPLPWLLGDFSMVGYYGDKGSPSRFDTDFLVVGENRINETERKLKKLYFKNDVKVRSQQDKTKMYLNYETFKVLYPNRKPEFAPLKQVELPEGAGLIAKYYKVKNWGGEIAFSETVPYIDFSWEGAEKPLPPPFSIVYEGEIKLDQGANEFTLSSDDGGFIEIDGVKIINDQGPHALTSISGIYDSLVPGWKKIRVGFYDIGGGAIVKLTLKKPNGVQEIPEEILRKGDAK